MESTTAMLFSKANLNAELSKDSEKEIQNEPPKEDEKKEIQPESKDNISSIESGINSISIDKKEEKEEKVGEKDTQGDNNINNSKEKTDFVFPIVSNKTKEESKNSEPNFLSVMNKAIKEQSGSDFSSINLNIPNNIKPKSNISTTQTSSVNIKPNIPPNLGHMFIPNYFVMPNPILKDYFGSTIIHNYDLSYFIPITFTCSLDTHKRRKTQTKSVEEEKAFLEKIINIAEVDNISEFWEVFQHLRKPSQCPVGTDYHVFKRGILPMWEDEMNKNGGKLSVLLTWKFVNVIWEEVIFNFAKGLMPHFEYINGIVISMRPKFSVLSFWLRTNTSSAVEKIRNSLSQMLQAPSTNCIDFIPFN